MDKNPFRLVLVIILASWAPKMPATCSGHYEWRACWSIGEWLMVNIAIVMVYMGVINVMRMTRIGSVVIWV